ncbi:flagellar hook-length control protein FliK [Paracoccus sp. (in: a-proteobacteria)]|uniref:flagellar hook-length control protein FliK n=1 Tax=Paracoccus sp. TaxID=267 RepID=UPI00272B4008|nr:flagellar hook-length control protein FliK [Paracoccus sp. (in: a-proteobacteria)]
MIELTGPIGPARPLEGARLRDGVDGEGTVFALIEAALLPPDARAPEPESLDALVPGALVHGDAAPGDAAPEPLSQRLPDEGNAPADDSAAAVSGAAPAPDPLEAWLERQAGLSARVAPQQARVDADSDGLPGTTARHDLPAAMDDAGGRTERPEGVPLQAVLPPDATFNPAASAEVTIRPDARIENALAQPGESVTQSKPQAPEKTVAPPAEGARTAVDDSAPPAPTERAGSPRPLTARESPASEATAIRTDAPGERPTRGRTMPQDAGARSVAMETGAGRLEAAEATVMPDSLPAEGISQRRAEAGGGLPTPDLTAGPAIGAGSESVAVRHDPSPIADIPISREGLAQTQPVARQIVAALAPPPAGRAMQVTTFEGVTEIALSPDELGRVSISVSGQDRPVIVIMAERPETLDLLRRNADQLGAELRDAGLDGSALSFRDGPPPGPRHLVRDAAPPEGAEGGSALTPSPAAIVHQAGRFAGHRIDIRL